MTSFQKHQRKIHFLWLRSIALGFDSPKVNAIRQPYFTHHEALKDMNQ